MINYLELARSIEPSVDGIGVFIETHFQAVCDEMSIDIGDLSEEEFDDFHRVEQQIADLYNNFLVKHGFFKLEKEDEI
ncbi:MAG: hypothetical protein WC437_04970 [Patescibacteria group bacterium]